MTEIRFGTISQVDHKKGTVKAVYNDLNIVSPELIVLQGRNKDVCQYSMPKVGENGLCLITETGNRGYYLGSGYDEENTTIPQGGEGKYVTLYPDGTTIIFDENNSTLSIDCKNQINITCPNISIQAEKTKIVSDIEIVGNVKVEGGITTSEDVVAGGISLIHHKTTKVKAGGDMSGPPA